MPVSSAPIAESLGWVMDNSASSPGKTIVRNGVSFGVALAIAISWSTNQSIFWAIVHGIFSWAYVIYFAIVS